MNRTTRMLINYQKLGMILFDPDFRVIEANRFISEWFSLPSARLPGTNLTGIFPELIGSESQIQRVLSGEMPEYRLEYVNRSDAKNTVHYYHLSVLPVVDDGGGMLLVENVTEKARLVQQMNQQKYELLLYRSLAGFRNRFLSDSLLGNSPEIRKVRQTIEKLSKVPSATVLLLGESGTGKNLVARVIHYSSMPPDAPFVEINCAALPENLIESELFGYEKGAFTHATSSRTGLLEEAQGGTIFLDEIGELPFNLQSKLLSVLETKRFRRLGSNKSIEVNLRIIAATNTDLTRAVAEKKFREDLFFRLNVVSITMPPLRMLGEDILIIARHFLGVYNLEFKKQVKGFSREAEQMLLHHSWPGNVRELSNCIERSLIFAERDWIEPEDLVLGTGGFRKDGSQWEVPPQGVSLEEIERELLLSALKRADGNKSKAARLLGLSRDTLRYRMEKYGLEA